VIRAALVLALALMAAACAGTPQPPLTATEAPPAPPLGGLVPAGSTAWSNRSLARVFVTLTHETEWGARRPHLVRLEAPVAVALEGPGSGQYRAFLARFLRYLRRHTGIAIAPAGDRANMHIRFVPAADFEAILPAAACLMAPGDLSWADYAARPHARGGDALVRAEAIEQMTVFLPRRAAPHAVRSCLIEEITQSLGPLNDLPGLGPSIFNDDFGHLWPTRLDLLMLRVLYHPEMRTGLSRRETLSRARAILERINSAGRRAPDLPGPRPRGTAPWREMILEVAGRGREDEERVARARQALEYAAEVLPGTNHHCHSLMLLGRVLSRREPERALAYFDEAERLCARLHGPEDVRLAVIRIEKAGALARLDRHRALLAALEGLEHRLAGHGLDERLAALYALQARAYLALEQGARAFENRRRARAWADYALGRENGALMSRLGRI